MGEWYGVTVSGGASDKDIIKPQPVERFHLPGTGKPFQFDKTEPLCQPIDRPPPELGNLANLNFLYLKFNQLTGSIPVELFQLPKLTTLHLESNQLDGLPNCSEIPGISEKNVRVYYNKLDFGDLDKNFTGPNESVFNQFTYYGQIPVVGQCDTLTQYENELFEYTSPMPDEHNLYQWQNTKPQLGKI